MNSTTLPSSSTTPDFFNFRNADPNLFLHMANTLIFNNCNIRTISFKFKESSKGFSVSIINKNCAVAVFSGVCDYHINTTIYSQCQTSLPSPHKISKHSFLQIRNPDIHVTFAVLLSTTITPLSSIQDRVRLP